MPPWQRCICNFRSRSSRDVSQIMPAPEPLQMTLWFARPAFLTRLASPPLCNCFPLPFHTGGDFFIRSMPKNTSAPVADGVGVPDAFLQVRHSGRDPP